MTAEQPSRHAGGVPMHLNADGDRLALGIVRDLERRFMDRGDVFEQVVAPAMRAFPPTDHAGQRAGMRRLHARLALHPGVYAAAVEEVQSDGQEIGTVVSGLRLRTRSHASISVADREVGWSLDYLGAVVVRPSKRGKRFCTEHLGGLNAIVSSGSAGLHGCAHSLARMVSRGGVRLASDMAMALRDVQHAVNLLSTGSATSAVPAFAGVILPCAGGGLMCRVRWSKRDVSLDQQKAHAALGLRLCVIRQAGADGFNNGIGLDARTWLPEGAMRPEQRAALNFVRDLVAARPWRGSQRKSVADAFRDLPDLDPALIEVQQDWIDRLHADDRAGANRAEDQ